MPTAHSFELQSTDFGGPSGWSQSPGAVNAVFNPNYNTGISGIGFNPSIVNTVPSSDASWQAALGNTYFGSSNSHLGTCGGFSSNLTFRSAVGMFASWTGSMVGSVTLTPDNSCVPITAYIRFTWDAGGLWHTEMRVSSSEGDSGWISGTTQTGGISYGVAIVYPFNNMEVLFDDVSNTANLYGWVGPDSSGAVGLMASVPYHAGYTGFSGATIDYATSSGSNLTEVFMTDLAFTYITLDPVDVTTQYRWNTLVKTAGTRPYYVPNITGTAGSQVSRFAPPGTR